MSIWLLHQKLTPEEEGHIGDRLFLTLPIDGLPDLSNVHSRGQCRQLLSDTMPDITPEALASKTDTVWRYLHTIHREDLVVVPLVSSGEAALGEIVEPYCFHTEGETASAHGVIVRWHAKRIPIRSFRPYQSLLMNDSDPACEIMDADLRTKIRAYLPYTYNRFIRMKWLLALFFIMGLIRQMHAIFYPTR